MEAGGRHGSRKSVGRLRTWRRVAAAVPDLRGGATVRGRTDSAKKRSQMTAHTRYRVEDGQSCIDLKVRHSRQLFDGRDPAPFRERDLDKNAVDYLLAAAQEIPRKQPLKIVVTISDEPEPRLAPDVIVEAVRGHFGYEREQMERRLREHVRRGQMILGVGLTVLVVFLTLAELTASLPSGPLREILREGFVITGWVAMWRPLEVLLYDWWPMVDERRRIGRILETPVSIRYDAETVPGTGSGDATTPRNTSSRIASSS